MKLVQIGARRNHCHALRIVIIVQPVLLIDLVMRAGNHQVSVRQHLFLGIDAAADIVGLLDFLTAEPLGQQALTLVPTQ